MKQILTTMACLALLGCSSTGVSMSEKDRADADQVEAALLARKSDIRSCYENETRTEKSKKSGRVSASFTIEPDGRVKKASIQSTTLQLPKTERCILEVIKTIHFPVLNKAATEVTYPFNFRPE